MCYNAVIRFHLEALSLAMKRFNLKMVFYPFLFLLYPVLFLYTHNIREVPFQQIFLPFGASIAVAIILNFLIGRFVKEKHKRGFLLFLFLILFFYYGDFYHFFNRLISFLHLTKASHFVTIYLFLSLWVIIIYFVSKSRKSYRKLTVILNISVIFLIIFNIYQIAAFLSKDVETSGRLNHDLQGRGTAAAADRDSRSHPDIYYLIFDELASLGTMQRMFDYDNAWFAAALRQRGFFIAEHSRTRFRATERSLASSLNMTYYSMGDDPFQLIRKNRVTRLLKEQGYHIINFTHWIKGTFELSDETYYYSTGKFSFLFSDFNQLLWKKSLFFFIYDLLLDKIDYHQYHRRRILYLLGQLEQIPSAPGPKFVFAHVVSPHDPYVFDREGRPVQRKNHFNLKEKRYFLNQYIYICKRIVKLVDGILQHSSHPPIIIIQGDHGFRGSAHGRQQVAVGDEWTHIFNAYHLPGKSIQGLHPAVSPVNSFRLIFNHFFAYKMSLLPD